MQKTTNRGRGGVTDAVVVAQVPVAAVGSLDRHFHFETLATPAHRSACTEKSKQ